MPDFRYTARTPEGETRSGSVSADDPDAARHELESQGLVEVAVEESLATPQRGGSVSEGALAERVAEIGNTGLPLAAGLRLLAEETHGGQRAALTALCDRLDAGEPPAEAFGRTRGITPTLAAVVKAGCRTGRIGPVLDQYVDRLREREDRRTKIRASIAYPVVLVSACLLVGLALLVFVVPGFRSIFEGFGTELPWLTETVVGLSALVVEYPLAWVAFGILCIVVVLAVTISGMPAVVQRGIDYVPVVGTALGADRLATFCDVLGTLVAERVPLPEALRLAADVSNDSHLARTARAIAAEAERGVPPDESAVHRRLPSGLRSAFLWQDDGDALGESLFAAGRLYDSRARANADLLASLVGPISVLVVATTVGMVATALFLPLVKLLNDLS